MNRRNVWLLTTPGAMQEGGCCCFSRCCYSCFSPAGMHCQYFNSIVSQVWLPLQNACMCLYIHTYSCHSSSFLLHKSGVTFPISPPLYPAEAHFVGPQLRNSIGEGQVSGFPSGYLPLKEDCMFTKINWSYCLLVQRAGNQTSHSACSPG